MTKDDFFELCYQSGFDVPTSKPDWKHNSKKSSLVMSVPMM